MRREGGGRSIRLKITDSQVLPPRKLGPSLPQVYSNAAAALLPFNIDSTQILSWSLLLPQQLFKPTRSVLRSIFFVKFTFQRPTSSEHQQASSSVMTSPCPFLCSPPLLLSDHITRLPIILSSCFPFVFGCIFCLLFHFDAVHSPRLPLSGQALDKPGRQCSCTKVSSRHTCSSIILIIASSSSSSSS